MKREYLYQFTLIGWMERGNSIGNCFFNEAVIRIRICWQLPN